MPAYLKEYRTRAGLTLQEVADRLGLKPPAIHKWEKEVNSPTLRDLARLAEMYGVPESGLFLKPQQSITEMESSQTGAEIDPATRRAVWAKIAGVHVTAWFHVDEDPERIDEARELGLLLEAYERLPFPLRRHLRIVAEAYPQGSVQGDG